MNRQDFINQLRKLVSLRTLPGEMMTNAKALDFVVDLMGEGIDIERVVNGKAEVLRAYVKKSDSPQYCFMVHMDVVAGRDDQFSMVMDGSRAIGRGTCDMKFSIPVGVALLKEAKRKGVDFCLMITTDEEIGGLDGARVIAEKGFSPKVLIVPDGGENLNFVDKAKGVCQIKLLAKGKPAHASRPWLGENAIDDLVRLAASLLEKYGENNKVEGWKTTMNIGIVNGGVSANQVCPMAEMVLDFRYPETDSVEKIVGVVRSIIRSLGLAVEVSVISSGLPTYTDVNQPEVRKYLDAMESVFGQKIVIKQTYGASDARHFAGTGSPVLMHKPIGGEIHSDNEWIDVDSVMTFYQGLRRYLKFD